MLKDIIVPLMGVGKQSPAINAAERLAEAQGASVRIIQIADLPPTIDGPWDLGPSATATAAQDAVRQQAEERARHLRERFAGNPDISIEVHEASTEYPEFLAARLAHAADLAIVDGWSGAARPDRDSVRLFNGLLFASGHPVLVMPSHSRAPLPPACAIVGWTSTPHACRALHDALPLLQATKKIHLVHIDATDDITRSEQAANDQLLAHLARHGVQAKMVCLPSKGHPPSVVLLAYAGDMKASLVVAGGYGHSRLREWSIGGMTRELLASAAIPVLYSH